MQYCIQQEYMISSVNIVLGMGLHPHISVVAEI